MEIWLKQSRKLVKYIEYVKQYHILKKIIVSYARLFLEELFKAAIHILLMKLQ